MSFKRTRSDEDGDRPPKRPRPEREAPRVEEIHSARQLQGLLTFNQDGIQHLRSSIASFKAFLEGVIYKKDGDDAVRQISILREYLDTQRPADPMDLERPILGQLWQAWSFANQNNNDSLASAVSAILALLLKTLSGILDLRDHGLLVARTVLQNQHLRLIKRNLEAPSHKEFVISPCLRLLTEIACFDGGVLAREIYKRREQTFDSHILKRNLNLVKTEISEEEAHRRPAIRTHALRYVLSLLKYLHEGGKTDILKNRVLCHAIYQYMRTDPAEVVNEVLLTLEQSVLKPQDMPRSAKAALLTSQSLERVREIASLATEEHAASAKATTWLANVCTNPSYGILRPAGWYPLGTNASEDGRDQWSVDLGLDSLDFYDNDQQPEVRNPVLLSWIKSLRPQSVPQHREIVLMCFKAAPELVAAFFLEKDLQLEPKLTNTWIGYASFLFEVAKLQVPDFLGSDNGWAQLPPQTSIMMENILPRPLSAKVLTRCLNLGSDLVTFFAMRILIVAFQKLSEVLRVIRAQAKQEDTDLWKEASDRLLQRFLARCPAMRDVTSCFRQVPDDDEHLMQREAISRLLRLYYEVTPLQALAEEFNISNELTKALLRSESSTQHAAGPLGELQNLELQHLLAIARESPGMKWFTTQGGLVFSPIVTLLKLHRGEVANNSTRDVLAHVLTRDHVLRPSSPGTEFAPLDALVASVIDLPDDRSLWSFMDDCICRASRKPVKYVDDLEAMGQAATSVDNCQIPSLLAAVLLEQASFVAVKQAQEKGRQAEWIMNLLGLLARTSDDGRILQRLMKQVRKTLGIRSSQQDGSIITSLASVKASKPVAEEAKDKIQDGEHEDVAPLPFDSLPNEPDNHPELTRLNQKDIDLAIEDGEVDKVVLCLCSQHGDIRKQAHIQLKKFVMQLRSSSVPEYSGQILLLLGELLETFEQNFLANDLALPYLAGTFTMRALRAQRQPAHHIYPKLNKFLIRGPAWRVNRMPAYWLTSTLLDLPAEEDAHWREIQWVLDWLVDGLRTPEDLNILRKVDAFERIMALWASPGAAAHKLIRERIMEFVFRTTCVKGGSDMLLTRAGVLAWLEFMGKEDPRMSEALRLRVLATVDQERMKVWSGKAAV